MKITQILDNVYEVISNSGKTYEVRYCGCGDEPDFVSLWECDCPAAKYHPNKLCKHVQAVIASVEYDEND